MRELRGSSVTRFCSFCFCPTSQNSGLHTDADSHHQKEGTGLPLRWGCLEKSCLFKLTAQIIKPTTVSKEHNRRNTVPTDKKYLSDFLPLICYSASGCLPLCFLVAASGCKQTSRYERFPVSPATPTMACETHPPEAATRKLCTRSPQRPGSKQVFVAVTEAGSNIFYSEGHGVRSLFSDHSEPTTISGLWFLLSNEVADPE